MKIAVVAAAAVVLSSLAAGCSGGGPDPEVARLRARVEAQALESDALGKQVRALEARSRALEEQIAAARPGEASAAKRPAPADGAPGTSPAAEPLTGVAAASAEAVASFLDTEQGRMKIREAIVAEEKRKDEEARAQRRERAMSYVKERVSGTLAEQLGLDAKQQQTIITIAADTMEKMEELWRGARDMRQADPRMFAEARQKTQEVLQQTQEKLQQALTVDQYTKLVELNAEGAGLFPGGGGFMGGFGGPTRGGGGGAPPQGGGGGGR